MNHKHKVKITSKARELLKGSFTAIVPSDWFTCKEHNPTLNMSVEFLKEMVAFHPDWFEVEYE